MLYGVAATSDNSVWAVGASAGRDGVFRTLIEHWNGSAWTAVQSPNPGASGDFLYGITASGGRVFASGQEFAGQAPDRPMLLGLSKHGWRVLADRTAGAGHGTQPSVSPFAIAAGPSGLWLAGEGRSGHAGYRTFVAAGGHGGLHVLATPNPTPQDNYLWGVAAAGNNSAWAVGDDVSHPSTDDKSLIEHGTTSGGWRIVPSPDPGLANGGNTDLGAVLAFGPDNAWAVGTFDGKNGRRTLILHFTGAA